MRGKHAVKLGKTLRGTDVAPYTGVVFAAHPAFFKLFVQTEWAMEPPALLARRRPRASDEPACWLVHALAGEGQDAEPAQYETDRARFIGRGYTLAAPRALLESGPLSGTVGNVLDPIISLRRTLELAPGGEARVTFLLGAAAERETALALNAPRAAGRKEFFGAWSRLC